MADSTIANLTALTIVAVGDLIPITDISDTTDSPGGTTKKITQQNLVGIWTKEELTWNGSALSALSHTPIAYTSDLMVNNQPYHETISTTRDYSISGTTVSLTTALPAGFTAPITIKYLYSS